MEISKEKKNSPTLLETFLNFTNKLRTGFETQEMELSKQEMEFYPIE